MRLLTGLLVLTILLAGCTSPTQTTGGSTFTGNTIEITSAEFSPSQLNAKVGETVTFVNKDAAPHWPASDVHPTHSVYPETGGCLGSTFDACKGLSQGESFSFKFTHAGRWCYHDHLKPGLTGCVNVQ